MTAFEIKEVASLDVVCDGDGGPLGHPRVYLRIDSDMGQIACPYCSRTYVFTPIAGQRAAH